MRSVNCVLALVGRRFIFIALLSSLLLTLFLIFDVEESRSSFLFLPFSFLLGVIFALLFAIGTICLIVSCYRKLKLHSLKSSGVKYDTDIISIDEIRDGYKDALFLLFGTSSFFFVKTLVVATCTYSSKEGKSHFVKSALFNSGHTRFSLNKRLLGGENFNEQKNSEKSKISTYTYRNFEYRAHVYVDPRSPLCNYAVEVFEREI